MIPATLLLGSVHSAVLAAVLWRRARNRRANHWLAALLVALSLLLIDGYMGAAELLIAHPHLIGLGAWLPYVLGPLLYLYVRALTAPAPAGTRPPVWRHFAVSALFLIVLAVTFYPRSGPDKLQFRDALARGDGPWFATAGEVTVLVHGFAYVIAALRLLIRHRSRVRGFYSSLVEVELRWLLVLVALNAAVWGTALAVFVVRITGHGAAPGAIARVGVPLGSTLVVFIIGYFQLGQVEVAPAPTRAPEPAPVPYQRARLADDDAAELEARLRAAMTDDHLYTRPGLTLAELADAVAATPHEVSQILSVRLQCNFYAFVNEHRVGHAKAALADPARRDVSVLDLAFEAGFRSKSTFNSAFRKATGVTPTEFRERGAVAAGAA